MPVVKRYNYMHSLTHVTYQNYIYRLDRLNCVTRIYISLVLEWVRLFENFTLSVLLFYLSRMFMCCEEDLQCIG